MKFVVFGAGAIGAYVGAALARGGTDVTLVARGANLDAMAGHGVRVESPRGSFQAHPPVVSDIDVIRDADVVFLGVKAYSLPELAPLIGERLRPDAVVIGAQNGIPWWYFQNHGGPFDGRLLESVDPGGAISRSFAAEHVIGCVIYCSTEIIEPGVIRHIEGTRFSIGTSDGEVTDRCREISAAFAAGGLKCPIDRSLRQQIWLKAIGNAAFNPTTTIMRSTMGALAGSPRAVALVRTVMGEGAAVATALGVRLPVTVERRLKAAFEVGDHRTSMLQDWDAGKPLELGCMTGAIVEIADMLGVPVPTTRVLHELLKAAEDLRDG